MNRAIVVDDRPENRDLLAVLLRGHGWEVEEARHGEEALAIARRRMPDVMISDLMMPVMDGYALLRLWRADAEFASVPFVVYTATYTDPADQRLALDLGADAFIVKPADPGVFLQRVEEVISLARRGSVRHAADSVVESPIFLEQYNASLLRKLEQRTKDLERLNGELAAREERYRQLFEANPHPMWVYDRETLQFLAVNNAAVVHYGYSHEEFLSMTIADIRPPADVPRLRRAVAAVTPGFIEASRWQHRKRDGTVIDVEIASHTLEFAGRAAEVVLAQDVTARLRAESDLHESEERFRELAETIREVFWITDADKTRMMYVSPAYEAIWGRSCASLYEFPQSWVEAIHPDDRDRVLEGAVTRQATGGYDEEYRIVRPAGDVRWIRDTAYPVTGQQGRVERLVGVARDITEAKQAQLQLLQAQKLEAVGLLAGGVAHDFNNLLTVILTEAEMLDDELGLESPFRGAVHAIRRAGERASGLTRQLLAFSRRQHIEPIVFPVNDVVAEMGSMLRRIVGEDVELLTELAPDAGSVLADRGQFEQVVMNLAVNARDALPNGGRLTLRTASVQLHEPREGLAAGPYVVLEARDTGAGMTDEVRARLFEPFFTTKEPGKGTGLGLSTCRGILRQAGGEIEVESRLHVGSTMRVLLPRAVDSRTAVGAPATKTPPRGGETVLLVEDDEAVRGVAARLLCTLGYNVLTAENGAAALQIVKEHQEKIHLLLTDVVMPGMSGREVAKGVSRIRPDIKTLYTTGYTDDVLLQSQLLDQRAQMVTKPYTVESLARRVREALDG